MKRHPIAGNKKSRKHSFSGFFIDFYEINQRSSY
ncbi:hypothetical protein BACCAC_03027 [Bacteroides caccae ATCC 43185]|nr:hypothetical protein BACCAC_03027 [Bacteroides caccae ATCC 43185]